MGVLDSEEALAHYGAMKTVSGIHERRFQGDAERLRSDDRLSRLEVERVVGLCLENLSIRSILDVGTGTGVFAEAFAKVERAVAGIDTNRQLLEIARRYVATGDFIKAAAEAIPFPAKSFDLVFLGLVLHETDDPGQALVEARRVVWRRAAVLEWPYQEEEHGPPLADRLPSEEIDRFSREAGFRAVEKLTLEHLDLYRLEP